MAKNSTKEVATIPEMSPLLKTAAVLDVDANSLGAQLAEVFAGSMNEFDLMRVKVPGGGATAWELITINGTESKPYIDGIILTSVMRRSWWRESFDESGGGNPPDCASDDSVHGYGVLPEDILKATSWEKEQGEAGGKGFDCKGCPLSQWGSDPKGRKGQACKQTRPLFFLPLNGVIPGVVVVPPGSLKSAQQWLLALLNEKVRPHQIVTRFSLTKVPGPPPYAQIQFAAAEKPHTKAVIPDGSELAKRVAVMHRVIQDNVLPTFNIEASDISE